MRIFHPNEYPDRLDVRRIIFKRQTLGFYLEF